MFVCASSDCFPDLGSKEVLERLVDLEYTSVELTLREEGGWLSPSEVHADLERAIDLTRATHRMTVAALNVDISAEGDAYYEQFTSICKLAKAVKVATIAVGSSELGTPFNEEVDRLKKLSAIASLEGAVVAMRTEIGTMSEDPETALTFCKHVPGLRLTLDPSCYITGPNQDRNFDKLSDHAQHTHLRDSTKEKFQVRVGQGEVDYGKLVTQLQTAGYSRALCVHMPPMEGLDHQAEMRKIRLLLDSLL